MKTILFFFCVTIPFWILAESQDSWKPIDLRKGNWIAVEGFQREYLNGIDSTFSKSKKISHFPVVLNEIFETSVGTGLKEYTLQTRFRIQEDFQKTKVYKPIFLYLESIGENWEIFLNDHSLAQEIHLDISHKEMILRRTIRSFRLPVDSSLLRSGENLLTFRLIGDAPASFLSKNVDLGFYIDGDYSLTTEQKLSGEISTLINLCLNTIYVFFGFYSSFDLCKKKRRFI